MSLHTLLLDGTMVVCCLALSVALKSLLLEVVGLNKLRSLDHHHLLLLLLVATLQHELATDDDAVVVIIGIVILVHGARAVVKPTRLINHHGVATIHGSMLLALLLQLMMSLLLPGLTLCSKSLLFYGQSVLMFADHFLCLHNGDSLDVGTHLVCHCAHHSRTVL